MVKAVPSRPTRCRPACTIAVAVGSAICSKGSGQAGLQRVGLLGTAFTMEEDFYRGRLSERFGLDVLVPEADDRREVHAIIYEELIAGVINERSRQVYVEVIERLVARGAQAIILGCTEIMLLVRAEDSPVPLFDTTTLHARAAVDAALA